jgi:predicted RNA-binding protein with PIN domain
VSHRQDLDELELLLIDGDNLLHDIRGARDEGGVAWLLPRLADWRPPSLRILVALDGHPAPGESRRPRAARGIEFQHSGSRSADDLIVFKLESMPYAQRARTAVVTRDRGLQQRARTAGALVRSVDWLMQRVSEVPSVASDSTRPVRIGQGKPPRGRHRPAPAADLDDDVRGGWQPGRGATQKKGNPRRTAKRSRRR